MTLVLFLGLLTPPAACAEERYFILIFGSQSVPVRPKYTHTWASIVKVTGCGCDLSIYNLRLDTISWMPATLDIKVWSRTPEPGVNLGLYYTLDLMLHFDERISLWGPYEIYPFTYQRGLAQKALMESGRVKYLCIDTFARDPMVKDCIHSITDADPEFDRRHYRLIRFGESASHHVARQFWERDRIINPGANHEWLVQALGLNYYPIIRREYRYRPGPFDDFGWRFRR